MSSEIKIPEVLLMAVIQSQDIDHAENALQKLNIHITRLASMGGFLGRRNPGSIRVWSNR